MPTHDMPLVSIITPNMNGERYLAQTIESILAQTYGRIEYIVIDGGSTDGSLDIIKRYEKYIASWVSEPDTGMYHAVNKGMARAQGDIVAYLNSDDLYFPDTVARVVDIFARHTDADLVYGNLDFIDSCGKRLFTQRYPDFDWRRFAMADYAMIGQPAAFWRKPLAAKVGVFDESLRMAADLEFFIRAGRCGRMLHVNDTLAAFRVHPASQTSKQLALSTAEVGRIRARYFPAISWLDRLGIMWSAARYKALNWRVMLVKLASMLREPR